MALKVVAKPLRVPRMRSDEAELVSRMVVQGKPMMTMTPLTSMRRRKAV
jgi:hypothetical protein